MTAKTVTLILVSLACGFILAYYFFGTASKDSPPLPVPNNAENVVSDDNPPVNNPFVARQQEPSGAQRIDHLESEIAQVLQRLQHIEQVLKDKTTINEEQPYQLRRNNNAQRNVSTLGRHLFTYENLVKGGVDQILAEDIVRRKNSIELQKLELQDRATRNGYLNSLRYYDELDKINSQDINLRKELGERLYDEFLYNNKQNNRVRIVSVMLDSAAEQAGVQTGDIVLSYDNQRMFNWQELKNATSEGTLGEYVPVSVIRDGEVYSLSVPRGPLGVQLGSARIQP